MTLSIEDLKQQNLILLDTVSGSRAYGLDTSESDTDTYDELNVLTTQIESRVNVVFNRLIAQYFKSNIPIVYFIAKMVIGQKKTDAVEYVRQVVKDDLIKLELIEQIK
jgi:hypothetical protein